MDITGLAQSSDFRALVTRLRSEPGRSAAFDIQSGAERECMERDALNRAVADAAPVTFEDGVEFARRLRAQFLTPPSPEQEIRAIEALVPELITLAARHQVPLALAGAMLRAYVSAVEWISVPDAARSAGLHRSSILRAIQRGSLAAEMRGRDWFVTTEALDRYLRNRQTHRG